MNLSAGSKSGDDPSVAKQTQFNAMFQNGWEKWLCTCLMEIRPALPSDVPQILTFIKELAAYEKLLHEVTGSESELHESLFGPSKMIEVLMALVDGKAIGYALFFTSFSTFLTRPGLYLEDLYVTPAARGKGAGIALIKAVAKLAVERGYKRLEWTVLDWNEPSIKFYESLGARPMSGWTKYRLDGDALSKFGLPQ